MRISISFISAALLTLSACASRDIGPINDHETIIDSKRTDYIADAGDDGSTVVALAFSGGGTRSAAFAYGVLQALDEIIIDEYPDKRRLIENVRLVSGTSGGAVAAAYFGMAGTEGYQDFREKFLYRNAEQNLRTSLLVPQNVYHTINGGLNDRNGLSLWLDKNLFHGKTFASLRYRDAPTVWLTASDIYNRTPFHFTEDTFDALCSDLSKVRLSDAVSASAAVPAAFAPVVVSAKQTKCNYQPPQWLKSTLVNPNAPLRLNAYARSLYAYRNDPDQHYIKLLDGGLTDNIGVTPFALARAGANNGHGPLSPEEAVKLRKLIFIVADAGTAGQDPWVKTLHGPVLSKVAAATAYTSISASVRDGFDALKLATTQWQKDLISYRCALPLTTVKRHRGTLQGWNCKDVSLIVEALSFRDMDAETQKRLNRIPTRFQLPKEQVDLAIESGRKAVIQNENIQNAVLDIQKFAQVSQAKHVLPVKRQAAQLPVFN
ncbi:patatin-like phospholipase family protein [Pseudochrobactrum sp. MP213Fo]|uniref:patatin-like phospholipase family protein n=1 Tax=Pseudochrobactrum sp. MP213Fo TaxID=3022250 RepID=UPI003B9E841C